MSTVSNGVIAKSPNERVGRGPVVATTGPRPSAVRQQRRQAARVATDRHPASAASSSAGW